MIVCEFPTVIHELSTRSWEDVVWPSPTTLPSKLKGKVVVGRGHHGTYHMIKALAKQVSLLHFDAHVDASEDNGVLHHGNWITRLLDEDRLLDVYQIGLRTDRHRPFKHSNAFEEPDLEAIRAMRGPVYLSIDLDVFDPAFAPAVATKVTGGLSPREVRHTLARVRGLDLNFCGCDIMEFSPDLDVGSITASLVAGLILDLSYLME